VPSEPSPSDAAQSDKARGLAIEQRLGNNLPTGFPVIDRFRNGVATSIKSMDLVAANGGRTGTLYITDTGRRYIDSVAGFTHGSRGTVDITRQMVRFRAVDLAVPPGATTAQRTALQELVEYGHTRGVTVNIIVIPH